MSIYHRDDTLTLLLGDATEELRNLPDGSVDCVVTSPPYYGLRDYGSPGQLGLEDTFGEYVDRLSAVFTEVRRVLAGDGTCWLNVGDSYSNSPGWGRGGGSTLDGRRPDAVNHLGHVVRSIGVPQKSMLGIPWRVAFALQNADWILRNAIIWHKPNAMPESVKDRLSTRYEHLFLLTKNRRYHFNLDAIREPLVRPEALEESITFGGTKGCEGKLGGSARRSGGHQSVYGGKHGGPNDTPPGAKPQSNKGATGKQHAITHSNGRNPGDVWTIPTTPLPDAHFAAFPAAVPRKCILAGCKPGGTVLDPFSGAGTTAMVAQLLGHKAIGIDINPTYHDIALRRMSDAVLPFEGGAA